MFATAGQEPAEARGGRVDQAKAGGECCASCAPTGSMEAEAGRKSAVFAAGGNGTGCGIRWLLDGI